MQEAPLDVDLLRLAQLVQMNEPVPADRVTVLGRACELPVQLRLGAISAIFVVTHTFFSSVYIVAAFGPFMQLVHAVDIFGFVAVLQESLYRGFEFGVFVERVAAPEKGFGYTYNR